MELFPRRLVRLGSIASLGVAVTSLLAKVDGAMNAIAVHGDAVGPTLFYGAGAGELPTASAVVADTMEIAREIRRGSAGRVAPLSYMPDALRVKPLVDMGELWARSYLVFTVLDRPGVLGQIASALGESGIYVTFWAMVRPSLSGECPGRYEKR